MTSDYLLDNSGSTNNKTTSDASVNGSLKAQMQAQETQELMRNSKKAAFDQPGDQDQGAGEQKQADESDNVDGDKSLEKTLLAMRKKEGQ